MIKIFRYIAVLSVLIGADLPLYGADPTEIESAINAAKEAPKNQGLNLKTADLLKDAGHFQQAIPFYLKSGNIGNLGIAECNFYLYKYDKADEYLEKYLAKRTKKEEEKDKGFSYGDGSETLDWTEYLRSRIELGRSMLDRVEKIQIIDSVNVPAEQFFTFIKLAKSAGRLADETEIEKIVAKEDIENESISSIWAPAYISESGEDVIWYGSSNSGESTMFESFRLADGTWDKPVSLFDYQSIFGDNNGTWVGYPYLMSDGVTLYFAADGDNSLGELDIFISRRDEDGFLQPSNIGMPYNSPYNDYMYAVDEVTGVGWWASDRNGLRDSVTIYTFIPQDLRINYPVETPGLIDYAKVSSIEQTQDAGTDYAAIKERIATISNVKSDRQSDKIEFSLPNGHIIRSVNELSNQDSKEAMRQYLSELESYKQMSDHLRKLRLSYGDGNHSVKDEILDLENSVRDRRAELKRLKNNVVNAEMN